MKQYKTTLTDDEIDRVVKSSISSKARIFPSNKIIYAKRKKDKVILKGLFCRATALINEIDGEKYVEIKTRFRLQYYFVFIFIVVFISMFLFADNVTINGETDPGIFTRLGFVLVGFLLFSLPVGIFVKLRSDYKKIVIDKLQLQEV